MGQPPEKGWGIDSGLSGTFAHIRPPPAAHDLVQEDNKPRKTLGALALEPPSTLPSPLHPPPQVHSTPALCSLQYILWLPKPALHPWTFFSQLSNVHKSHNSAVDPGAEDDAAWLGQPGNHCPRRARLRRATASHCPALRERRYPRFPFKGGAAYWDPEGHAPHPEATEVHLGEPVLISKMTAKSNKQNYPLRQSREGPNDCRVSREQWSPME